MPYLKRQAPCPEPIDCKILTAALSLFVEKGYYNVSIHEIQKQADVSIGSIYRHFNGKEGVATALYKHVLNEVDELIDAVIEKKQPPTKQLEEIIKQLFEHTETHPEIISFIFHTKHTDFLANEPLMCDAAPFDKIRNIIMMAIECNELKKTDVQFANSIIIGSVMRLIQLRLDGLLDKPLNKQKNDFLEVIYAGLK